MNLIERAKNMLFTPKTEWQVVSTETATPGSLLTSYVLPMAIVSLLGTVIGFFLFSRYGWTTNTLIVTCVIALITSLLSYFLTSLIVDALAPSFSSEKNAGRSAQLVAYASTPGYIAGLLSFIPGIGLILTIAGFAYSIYLLYLGIGPMKNTPEDKKVVYILVAAVIMIAIYFVIAAILGAILVATMMGGSTLRY